MSKKKNKLNKAPSKMTVGELCDEMSIRATEHGALPAWLVRNYAEDIVSSMKKAMSGKSKEVK